MAKLYALDNKLLTDAHQIVIGEKCYPVDNRTKTVKKLMRLHMDDGVEELDKAMQLAFGENAAKEIDQMNLPWPAYQKLIELVMAAVTGEDADDSSTRFQEKRT